MPKAANVASERFHTAALDLHPNNQIRVIVKTSKHPPHFTRKWEYWYWIAGKMDVKIFAFFKKIFHIISDIQNCNPLRICRYLVYWHGARPHITRLAAPQVSAAKITVKYQKLFVLRPGAAAEPGTKQAAIWVKFGAVEIGGKLCVLASFPFKREEKLNAQ